MPKRGENIRKRKDGRWEARYIKDYTLEGKANYVSIYGKTYYETKKKLVETAEKINRNEYIQGHEVYFREVLYLWLSNNKIKLKQQTYSKYLELIENHIIPSIGHIKITKIDTLTINRFIENKSYNGRLDGNGGLSVSSMKSLIFIIQSTFAFASKEGLRVPIKGDINRPVQKKRELKILNRQEQFILEKYMSYHFDTTKLGIVLSLYIGLRIGEICGLKWSDINFEEKTIHIKRTVERIRNINRKSWEPKTKLIISDPKTLSSNRIIPIPEYLMIQLDYLRVNAISDYVVSGITNEYLDPRTLQYRFQKCLKECKLREINFHALRHTFATRCIEVGVDIKSLSEILGHASVNITLNTYVHSSIEQKRNQLELLSSVRGQ